MPGVESFEVHDEKHWTAQVKVPLGLGGLKMTMNFEKLEEREPVRVDARVDRRRGARGHDDVVHAVRGGRGHVDGLGGRRQDRRPGGSDGPARPAADRESAGRQVLGALEQRVGGANASTGEAEAPANSPQG